MICRKATLRFSMLISSLPGANSRFPEHKIGVFVLFWPSGPSFSGISSTKSRFLCFFGLRDPRFRAFRAQNQGFCALLPSETPIFRPSEHKIEVFVSEMAIFPWICPLSSTKSAFLCSRGGESGIRKRNRGDAYPSCNSPRILPKRKFLITN